MAAEAVVAGHVCLDIIPELGTAGRGLGDLFTPGNLATVGPAVVSGGGCVSNAGLALHRLGVRTRLLGKIGDDLLGRTLLGVFDAQDRSLRDGMRIVPGEHTSYTIVINPPGVDRMFLHCPGANDTFGADDVDPASLAGARVFHFGYPPIMRRMFVDGGGELEGLFRKVKELGITTSLDMSKPDTESEAGRADWRRLLARVLPLVDMFSPSLDEIRFMLGGGELRQIAEQLLAMGAAIVLLKLGDQGAQLRTTRDRARLAALGACRPRDLEAWRDREIHAPCFAVNVAGTTGSGDCTSAGFLTALLRGLAPEAALTAAVAVGACSVERPDATSGVPRWEAVQQRIAAGWARR